MLTPVLITPPTDLPVSVDEAKKHLHIDAADDDTLLTGYIEGATGLLDGWAGLLGRAIMRQTWRQSFADLKSARLVVGPFHDLAEVRWIGTDGATVTGSPSDLTLAPAPGGTVMASWAGPAPTMARRVDAVTIDYRAGVEAGKAPAVLKTAILLLVGHLNKNRDDAGDIPEGVKALVRPFRNRRV